MTIRLFYINVHVNQKANSRHQKHSRVTSRSQNLGYESYNIVRWMTI